MKNKYNLLQVAQVYCEEIGVEIPFMYDYLVAVMNKQPIEEYDKMMKETIYTNSEYFPELGDAVENKCLDEVFRKRPKHKWK